MNEVSSLRNSSSDSWVLLPLIKKYHSNTMFLDMIPHEIQFCLKYFWCFLYVFHSTTRYQDTTTLSSDHMVLSKYQSFRTLNADHHLGINVPPSALWDSGHRRTAFLRSDTPGASSMWSTKRGEGGTPKNLSIPQEQHCRRNLRHVVYITSQ